MQHARSLNVGAVELREEAWPHFAIWSVTVKRGFSSANGGAVSRDPRELPRRVSETAPSCRCGVGVASVPALAWMRDQNPSSARLIQLTAKIEPADVMTAAREMVKRRIRRAMMIHRKVVAAADIARRWAGSTRSLQDAIRMGLFTAAEVQSNRYKNVGRSIRLASVVDGLLVDPVASVVAAPNPAVEQSPGDRTPWHHHRPKVPNLRPCRLRLQAKNLKRSWTIGDHVNRSLGSCIAPLAALLIFAGKSFLCGLHLRTKRDQLAKAFFKRPGEFQGSCLLVV